MKSFHFLWIAFCLLYGKVQAQGSLSYQQWLNDKQVIIDMTKAENVGNQEYKIPIYVRDSIANLTLIALYDVQKVQIIGAKANGLYNWSESWKSDSLKISLEAHSKMPSQQVVLWLYVKSLQSNLDSSVFSNVIATSNGIGLPIKYRRDISEMINPTVVANFVSFEINPTNVEELIIHYPNLVQELALYDASGVNFIENIPVTIFSKSYWVFSKIPAGQYLIKINQIATKTWVRP